MLTFIPLVLLVLQKKESSDLDGDGTLPGLCLIVYGGKDLNVANTN